MWKDDALLVDVLLAARKIAEFAHGKDKDDFMRDEVLQHAVIRLITIMGEAAAHVSLPARASHPAVPWGQIIGMRNRVVHGYFRVNLETVWDTVQRDIPLLIVALERDVPKE